MGRPATATSTNQTTSAANAVDGNAASYWESANNAFPQSLTVDLGASRSVDRVVLKLPDRLGAHVPRPCRCSAPPTARRTPPWRRPPVGVFDPARATPCRSLPSGDRRYVRVTVTGNTGWPAAPALRGRGVRRHPDHAAAHHAAAHHPAARPPRRPAATWRPGGPITETSHADVYGAANAVDGNANTYWESANNAFPQSLTVDLGADRSVSRVVLKLPAVIGLADPYADAVGARLHRRLDLHHAKASAGYTLQPGQRQHGHRDLHRRPPQRYLRLTVTGNTGWPAGQLSRVRGLLQLGRVPPPGPGGGTRSGRSGATPRRPSDPVPSPTCRGTTGVPLHPSPGNAPTPTPERGVATPCPGPAPDEARRRPARPAPSPAPPARAVGCSPARSPGCSSPPPRSSPPRPARHRRPTRSAAAARVAMLAGLSATMTASSYNQNYGAGNANDGNAGTYWESANNAFPQWVQVDLGAAVSVNQVVLKLPPSRLGDPHADAVGAGQHQRLDLHRPCGVRRLHVQPGAAATP